MGDLGKMVPDALRTFIEPQIEQLSMTMEPLRCGVYGTVPKEVGEGFLWAAPILSLIHIYFPHPVARAVVRAAEARNLKHREKHSEVEYIVAHGIASSLEGKRVVIGSEHFVVEDEGVLIEEEKRERISRETEGLSPLYLAVDGELVGVIGIEDPIKPNVPTVLRDLRSLGFGRIIMLTGDNEKTAECIARQAGVSEFHANLLPEDKHAFVRALREEGASIVMVGDGVNDSPALSEANVGIAMGEGSAIAREVAGITLVSDDLSSIVALRKLSMALMDLSLIHILDTR